MSIHVDNVKHTAESAILKIHIEEPPKSNNNGIPDDPHISASKYGLVIANRNQNEDSKKSRNIISNNARKIML